MPDTEGGRCQLGGEAVTVSANPSMCEGAPFAPASLKEEGHAQFVRMIGQIVTLVESYPNSPGKDALWALLVAATAPQDWAPQHRFREVAAKCCLLSLAPDVFFCEFGIVVHTERFMQINANLIVPSTVRTGVIHDLVSAFLAAEAGRISNNYALNLSPIVGNLAGVVDLECAFYKRKFIWDADDWREMHVHPGARTIALHNHATTACWPISPHGIQRYTPITMAKPSDDVTVVYWGRFHGLLVAVKNALCDVVPPVRLPTPASAAVDCAAFVQNVPEPLPAQQRLYGLLRALFEADRCEYGERMHWSKETVADATLPVELRRFVLNQAFKRTGLDDDLVQAARRSFGTARREQELVDYICVLGDCMAEWRGWRRERRGRKWEVLLTKTYKVIVSLERRAARDHTFAQYARTSHFVRGVTQHLALQQIRELLDAHSPTFVPRLIELQQQQPVEAQVALLAARGLAPPALVQWLDEQQRQRSECEAQCVAAPPLSRTEQDERGETTVAPDTAPPASTPSDTHSPPAPLPDAPPDPPSPPDDSPDDSPDARCERLAARLGLPCQLVGSSRVFTALPGTDMDVAICVEAAATLERAYETVLERARGLGWELPRSVTGDAVVAIRGRWEGVEVDAQVWRGSAGSGTASERHTARAIDLAQLLAAETCDTLKADIRDFHRWAEAARLKGHVNCLLPGVAITCVAIVLRCQHNSDATDPRDRLRHLLAGLCDVLSSRAPLVEFNQQRCSEPGVGAAAALRVLVGGENVCGRMSRLTTRHVARCAAAALALDDPFDAAAYEAWRARELLPSAWLAPTRCVPAVCLHRIAAVMDDHPCLDGVVFERGPGDAVRAWVALAAAADAERYGFRADDEWLGAAGGALTFRRGGRTHAAPLVEGQGGVERGAARFVTDLLRVDGRWSVRNAPFVARDVEGYLARYGWEARVGGA